MKENGNEATVLSLEYSRALKLNKHIKAHAQLADESLYEVWKGLKEMRDSELYRELEYQTFEDYCREELGFTRQYAYDRISIIEKLPADFVNARLQIGVTKFRMIASASEPVKEKIMQQDDIETISSRKFEKRIKELETQQKQAESALQTKQETITRLERQVNELESRPVEVMQSTAELEEIERLKKENSRLETENETLEKQLAEKSDNPEEPPEMKQFRIQLATVGNCMKQLVDFLIENPDTAFLDKSEHALKGVLNSLDEIRKQVQP